MIARLLLALAFTAASLPSAGAFPSDQSLCFNAAYGARHMAQHSRQLLAALDISWFSATDQLLDETGAVKDGIEPQARRDIEELAAGPLKDRRFYAFAITIRLRGQSRDLEDEPGGLGGLCVAADNALICKADCQGGRFTVRSDGASRIRIVPEAAGLTLNACHAGKPRLRVDARNPLPRLRQQSYDVCGNP
jgi:hypothetical protein